MSFEKEGKGSGTRRKARECALQMLFAVDLVGTDRFSAERYWSELGFDEVVPGAGLLAQDLLEQIVKLEKHAADIRSWLKRAEPYDKSTSRLDRAKDLAKAAETLQAQYRAYIEAAEKGLSSTPERVAEQISGIRVLLERLINDIETTVIGGRKRRSEADRKKFIELREDGPHLLAKASKELLPQVIKMIDQVRPTRAYADKLYSGAIEQLGPIDDRIKTRAEHWRIERMAIVDRNVLRLSVYEFLYEDTPHTVVINEALEIARRFSTFEATQFVNGILDGIKLDLEKGAKAAVQNGQSQAS